MSLSVTLSFIVAWMQWPTEIQDRTRNNPDDWITPRWITQSLGIFDLDPCECIPQPWKHAKQGYNLRLNGLKHHWFGRVWLNPPYSNLEEFLFRLSQHGNGITLIYARTSKNWFHQYVFNKADAIFFFKNTFGFAHPTGIIIGHTVLGCCLAAYGKKNVIAIRNSQLNGRLICMK